MPKFLISADAQEPYAVEAETSLEAWEQAIAKNPEARRMEVATESKRTALRHYQRRAAEACGN